MPTNGPEERWLEASFAAFTRCRKKESGGLTQGHSSLEPEGGCKGIDVGRVPRSRRAGACSFALGRATATLIPSPRGPRLRSGQAARRVVHPRGLHCSGVAVGVEIAEVDVGTKRGEIFTRDVHFISANFRRPGASHPNAVFILWFGLVSRARRKGGLGFVGSRRWKREGFCVSRGWKKGPRESSVSGKQPPWGRGLKKRQTRRGECTAWQSHPIHTKPKRAHAAGGAWS